jgi:hydrogenase maturation protein HypF
MSDLRRVRIQIQGVVQGVGFRPFVYRLARELSLHGFVRNDGDGVFIEVEGTPSRVQAFLNRLPREKPPPAILYTLEHQEIQPRGDSTFRIVKSDRKGPPRVWILPDLATCEACRRELMDPDDRRFRYPFINCTHCGPRFTIIESLPYDRPRTTMKRFQMCARCAREYEDPEDRRFHAQPNACARCGPRLFWYEPGKEHPLFEGEDALREAIRWIRQGRVVAVKGLGGMHLVVDARSERALQLLRRRKRRPRKPFALMYPDVETLRRHVWLPEEALAWLTAPQAPILLLPRTSRSYEELAPSVAPGSPYLGVFLPYTPLHLLLLADLGFPVVATSGNLSEDPMEFENEHARHALQSLVDGFLLHDRPIRRHVDDSVVLVLEKPERRTVMVRRARGYVPLPVLAPRVLPSLVALGGHMNVTFALARGREMILSQHLGEMEGWYAREVYQRVLEDFLRLYEIQPEGVVHDLHPDYFTTALAAELAGRLGVPALAVQHHHAHLAAVLLEFEHPGPAVGLTWDGTGYGEDGTIWGGEILVGDAHAYRRVASLWPFRLPGGGRAIKEPWRIAYSLLIEAFEGDVPREIPLGRSLHETTRGILDRMLQKGIQAPITTSMGRLFDGVSALLGLVREATHQAEAAQQLEYAAWMGIGDAPPYPLPLVEVEGLLRLDWRPMIRQMVEEILNGASPEHMAFRFHRSLVDAIDPLLARFPDLPVVCGGGVFLNRLLDEMLLEKMRQRDRLCLLPHRLPPTDGALAAGQLWVAAHQWKEPAS